MDRYLQHLLEYVDKARDWVTDSVDDMIRAFQGKGPRDAAERERDRAERARRRAARDEERARRRAANQEAVRQRAAASADEPDEPRRGREAPRDVGARRGIEGDAAVIVATREDDVASVVGRIDTADTPEVVLVVRRDARMLRRPTAWPHIAAHVRRRGIELGVVSTRGDVRSFARENGLRVARTPRGLRGAEYYLSVGERDYYVPPVPWGRIIRGGMIATVLIAGFVVGCYQVPSADVRLVPESEEVSIDGVVRPNAIIEQSDLDTMTISARTVRRQLITAVTTTTTGEVEVGEEPAVITVEFANSSARAVRVPAETIVQTEGAVAFLTDEDLEVPANESASVTATAAIRGAAGNVEAGTVTTIASDVPSSITIATASAGTGGTNVLGPGVAEADVARVRGIADDVLDRIALATLELAVLDEELGTLLPSSVRAAILAEEPLQQLDEPSDILVVEYTIIASGIVVTQAQADAYGELLLRDEMPEGHELLSGTVRATVAPSPDNPTQMTITASGAAARLADYTGLPAELKGKRPGDAREYLENNFALQEPPVITINPTFIPWIWLPRQEEDIQIVISGPTPEETPEPDDEDDDDLPIPTGTADIPGAGTATATPTASGG